METRVNDYIDDKLQTADDIDNIDALLQRVLEQQELLNRQLKEAKAALDDAQRASESQASLVLERSQAFRQKQAEIDQRLLKITQSNTSDEAVKRFEVSMGKLRRLEIASGYMEILQEVDKLGAEARRSLKSAPRSSIAPYVRLRTLAGALKDVQPAAEGAAPHLIDQVDAQATKLYQDLRNSFESDFHGTLNQMAWPKKDLKLSDHTMKMWTEQVKILLDLQDPDLKNGSTHVPLSKDAAGPLLLPLELMVQPLDLRFRFHFYGDKPTNRIDKPEYFLSHILDLLDQHSRLMSQYLQPVLDDRIAEVDEYENIYPDAVSAFITALLPMVSAKCLSLLPQIASQPQLLSHFIHELMSFDTTLRDVWAHEPIPHATTEWKGLTWSMLSMHDYFNTWLGGEKQFALSRYQSIRDAADSGDFDFDSTSAESTKPTKGAIRVNDLLETITDRYRSLTSFGQKLKFLIDIQLAIFDDYHSFLYSSLQTFLASTHTAGRFIQGQIKVDKGLDSLCKIFGSAEYLERKMADWSDDVFFLELWDELQHRAKNQSRLTGFADQEMSVNEVAAKTSSTIVMNGGIESDGGALFDETAGSYRQLRERTELEIVRMLENHIRTSIRPFCKMSGWASLSNTTTDSSLLSPSASLDSTLQLTSSLLGFLATVLSAAPLRRITRQTCQAIQKEIWDNILSTSATSFSVPGVAQFRRDVTAIENVIDSGIKSPGEAYRGMRKLEDALALLELPIRFSNAEAPAAEPDEEGWGFDDEKNDDQDGELDLAPVDSEEPRSWSLWDVNKRLFKNNDAARQILSELGLSQLSESEARNIIERRVELSS